MITGELKGKIDRVWDAFWSGGISNPLEVIEQITYLLFMRRLDEVQTLAESKAKLLGNGVIEDVVFLPDQQQLRWSRLKNMSADDMFATMSEDVFPFLRKLGTQLGGNGSTYSEHMKDARFTIPNAALLTKVVDLVDEIPMADRDTNGDLYEYLLSKIASAGVNGQFRTPRHIISLMVDLMAPTPQDVICDPACGTAGFLVGATEYLREHHPSINTNATHRQHFHDGMFHGYDFDKTMLRIGSMNMMMHGVQRPDIAYRDSLSEGAAHDEGRYSVILANPPFAGSLDYEQTSAELLKMVKTKKTELLFLALFLKLLSTGGRAAVIVPDGVLFGSSKAHKDLRKELVEKHSLDAVIKLPSGVFRPYAGVSTAILLFTKTGVGGTKDVWFYDVRADGFSLDDKRNPIAESDLDDVRKRWKSLTTAEPTNTTAEPTDTTAEPVEASERDRARTEQSFMVPKAEIVAQGYDLSINRYKEVVYEEVEHRAPREIIAEIEKLDVEIAQGFAELKAMLS